MNTSPSTRHERHRQRTRKLLQTALMELILEKGYDAVSIQDITDRADLARATFYLHARDKEELMWSLIEDVIHATEEVVQAQYTVVPPQAEYYGYWNIFEHAVQHKDIYKVILGNKGSAIMARRVHDYMVGETLKDIGRLKIYTDINAPSEITAQIVIGAILNLAIWWLETPNDYTTRQMADMLYEVLHHKKPPALAQ